MTRPGRVVEKVCAGCHAFTAFTESRGARDHWEEMVQKMASRGAERTDSELDQVVGYLTRHFGPDNPVVTHNPIAINTLAPEGRPAFIHSGTSEELTEASGLSAFQLAETIWSRATG